MTDERRVCGCGLEVVLYYPFSLSCRSPRQLWNALLLLTWLSAKYALSRSPRQLWNALLLAKEAIRIHEEQVAVPVNYGMLSYSRLVRCRSII